MQSKATKSYKTIHFVFICSYTYMLYSMEKQAGKRLDSVIRELGLNPTPLALRFGHADNYISRLIKSKDEVILKNSELSRICKELGINRDYIITGDGPKFINIVNEPVENYGLKEENIKLRGQIELLIRMVNDRDEIIKKMGMQSELPKNEF